MLKPLIGFKSISTNTDSHSHVSDAVSYLAHLFLEAGFSVKKLEGVHNPLVFAEFVAGEGLPACLVYGHYDVQPATAAEGWHSDPFGVTERDGRLFARGIADNKGQFMIHVAAVCQAIADGALRQNVKFLIEGDEESGSDHLLELVTEYKDLLKADCILVSDGELAGEKPAFSAGFRGGFNAALEMRTGEIELHSGLFGGAVPNASHELVRIIGSLRDAEGRIAVPGMYENLPNVSSEERIDPEEFAALASVKGLNIETEAGIADQIGLRPTIQLTSLTAGYQGSGFRNSVPNVATAKINVRVAPGQDVEAIWGSLQRFLNEKTPSFASLSIEMSQANEGCLLDMSSPQVEAARNLLAEVYGESPVARYSGGSLPVVTYFQSVFGVPQLLIGLANEDCAMHGANENFRIDLIKKGLEFSYRFFTE